MRNFLSLIIIFFISMNINLPSWAVSNEVSQKSQDIYSLDNNYQNSFLVSNRHYDNDSFNNTKPEEDPLLGLNYLFPGLGSIIVGEPIGSSFFNLGLIPVIGVLIVAIIESQSRPLERGWGLLGALILAVPFYSIVYFMNVFVTTFQLATSISKK